MRQCQNVTQLASGSRIKMVNKGPWQKEEDNLLREQVEIHQGANAWGKIAEVLGTRSAKQCRERWHQNIKPGLNHTQISDTEAAYIIAQVRSRGKRWAEIARAMQGRSDNMIKNWWNGSNNRRAREATDQRRAQAMGQGMGQAYPMHMQQSLPQFQPAYPVSLQVPPQPSYNYVAQLPYPSPVTPTMYQTTEPSFYQREPPMESLDRRPGWTGPDLHIDAGYLPEQRRSISSVTTPTQASPVTPSNNVVFFSHALQQQEPDHLVDPQIRDMSSRRGSAYSEIHRDFPEQPSVLSDHTKDSRSTMAISRIID